VETRGSPRSTDVNPDPGVRNGAATQEVHDRIRNLILAGDLPPGSEISQLELTRTLGVGRTPLREALRLLQREGLIVDNGSHRALSISPLTMVDLDEVYSLRVMGEALAVWLSVPTFRESDLDELDRLAEGTAAGDAGAHRRFHSLLRVGAGIRLREHLDRLFEHAERYQRAFRRYDSAAAERQRAEHRKIADACRARDRDLARELLVDHVATTAISLMTAERHAPFTLTAAVEMAKASSPGRSTVADEP
jgi:DNA-binding GntR family transcriptional regulator